MRKMQRVLWFVLIRAASLVAPPVGTRLAIRFYERAGMNFDGHPTYIGRNVWFDSTEGYRLITLSEGVTISSDVRVLTHDWAPSRTLWSLGRLDRTPIGRREPVAVGPWAFIGLGSILMPGAQVGRGAIIGAGSVVRGAVPDYAIVMGNPGTIVGDAREYVQRKFPEEWAKLPPSSERTPAGGF